MSSRPDGTTPTGAPSPLTTHTMNLRKSGSLALSAALLSSLATGTVLAPSDAEAAISDAQIENLNPRRSKYGTCPSDSPCYILETRIIRAKVADPSESSGDENYILPIWAIVDGMGVDAHPLATDSDDFFRVNVARKTISDADRSSNLGSMFWQRETGSWVDLRSRAPEAYQLHQNKDFVIPVSRDRWTSEGLIFSVNMMEHDNSSGRDIDRSYLQAARKVQAGLLQGATQARVSIKNPTYYGNAIKATTEFMKKAAPIAAKAYTTYQTGGAAAAAAGTAASVDLDEITSMFSNLWKGIAKLDKDDVGQQVSTYIPFASLQPGVEKTQVLCGKTDPSAMNTGKFCVEIGVKLTPFSSKRTASAFDRAASNGQSQTATPSDNGWGTSTNNENGGGTTNRPNRQANGISCENGRNLGRFALRSELTGKFVRGGVTAGGTNTAVGAKADQIGGSNSWETFDIYDLGNRGGLNGNTYAFRSSLRPDRWLSVASNGSLQLAAGACTTATRSSLFLANQVGNILQMQALGNQQWVIQRSNGMLFANAPTAGGNVPKALQFSLQAVGR